MSEQPKWLTVQQVAEVTSTSRRTVWEAAKRGDLKGSKTSPSQGGKWLFTEPAVEAWMTSLHHVVHAAPRQRAS